MSITGKRTRKGTCNCCKKRRKLYEREQFRWYCEECYYLSPEEIKEKWTVARSEQRKKPTSRVAYPIIGGPLDGLYAIPSDFYSASKWSDREEGMYHKHQNEYDEYNASRGSSKRIAATPSMIFIHKSLLKPLISPKDR